MPWERVASSWAPLGFSSEGTKAVGLWRMTRHGGLEEEPQAHSSFVRLEVTAADSWFSPGKTDYETGFVVGSLVVVTPQ